MRKKLATVLMLKKQRVCLLTLTTMAVFMLISMLLQPAFGMIPLQIVHDTQTEFSAGTFYQTVLEGTETAPKIKLGTYETFSWYFQDDDITGWIYAGAGTYTAKEEPLGQIHLMGQYVTAASYGYAYRSDVTVPNQFVAEFKVIFDQLSASPSGASYRIMMRNSLAGMRIDVFTDRIVSFYEYPSGTWNTIDYLTVTSATGTWYILRFEVDFNTLEFKVYRDGGFIGLLHASAMNKGSNLIQGGVAYSRTSTSGVSEVHIDYIKVGTKTTVLYTTGTYTSEVLDLSATSFGTLSWTEEAIPWPYPWSEWTKYSGNPVLSGPALVENILTYVDSGEPILYDGKYWLVYSPSTSDIRLAYSTDPNLLTWTPYAGNPILSPGPGEYYLYSPNIFRLGDTYYLFYDVAKDSPHGSAQRIAYATANSPIGPWTKGPVILDIGAPGQFDEGRVGEPFVLKDGGTYYLFYMGDGLSYGSREQIALATTSATDFPLGPGGGNWTKYGLILPHNPDKTAWDSGLTADPSVIKVGTTFYMLYTGSYANVAWKLGIAYATSPSGPWTRPKTPQIPLGPSGSWDDDRLVRGAIHYHNGKYIMPYTGNDGSTYRGGIATANPYVPETLIEFQTRTSPDGSTWEEWKSVLNGASIQSSPNRYFQYQTTLHISSLTGVSPTLTSVTINYQINSPPTAPTVDLTPDLPKTTDDLVATVTSPSTDPEGDPITYTYEWYKDGILQKTTVTPALSDTVSSALTMKGEVWRVLVTPFDGTVNGPSAEDQVTIQNSPPTAPTVDVTPDDPTTLDNLVCTIIVPSTDSDGDSITYTYAWYKDGILQPSLTSNTVPESYTTRGEVWKSVVTPNDGTVDGLSGEDQVTIRWQYYLTVTSPYGATGGEGWYDVGATAYATLDIDVVSGGDGVQYVFTNWSNGASGINYAQSDPITMDADKTAMANWKTQYYLTMFTNYGTVSPGSGWYDAGTTVDIQAFAPSVIDGERYVWLDWTGTGTISYSGMANPALNKVTMDSPITETASWRHEFRLTMTTNFGTTSPSVGENWYESGTKVNIEAFAPSIILGERYVWLEWTGTGDVSYTGIDNPAFSKVTMNSPITEAAAWRHEFRLTMATNFGSTSPSVGEHWYEAGTVLTISATAPSVVDGERCAWRGWTGTGTISYSGMDNPATDSVTMNSPITETAAWTHEYRLIMATNFGTTTPSVGENWYEAGTPLNIQAFAPDLLYPADKERYVWLGWTGSGLGSYSNGENPASITMNGPITETAKWRHEYYLSVRTEPPNLDSPTGEGWYDEGTEAIATADMETSGWTLYEWKVDGVHKSFDTYPWRIKVTMDAPHDAVVVYKINLVIYSGFRAGDTPSNATDPDLTEIMCVLVKTKYGYKLAGTAPGTYDYATRIYNTGTTAFSFISITVSGTSEFYLKGATPIRIVNASGYDITSQFTVLGTWPSITINSNAYFKGLPGGSYLYVAVHLDYNLKGTIVDKDPFYFKAYLFQSDVTGMGEPDNVPGTEAAWGSTAFLSKKTTIIYGFVREWITGKPVEGAIIDLYHPNGTLLYTEISDAEGFFSFINEYVDDLGELVSLQGGTTYKLVCILPKPPYYGYYNMTQYVTALNMKTVCANFPVAPLLTSSSSSSFASSLQIAKARKDE